MINRFLERKLQLLLMKWNMLHPFFQTASLDYCTRYRHYKCSRFRGEVHNVRWWCLSLASISPDSGRLEDILTKMNFVRFYGLEHRKTSYGEKPHRPTVFGCYVDLTGFVMSEQLQSYCFILPKTNSQQVYG